MKGLRYYREITAVGGAASYNTPVITGRLTAVRVKPASGTTIWTLTIVGPNGFIVYKTENITGEQSDIGLAGMLGLMQGIHTITLATDTNEQHNIQLEVEQFTMER